MNLRLYYNLMFEAPWAFFARPTIMCICITELVDACDIFGPEFNRGQFEVS